MFKCEFKENQVTFWCDMTEKDLFLCLTIIIFYLGSECSNCSISFSNKKKTIIKCEKIRKNEGEEEKKQEYEGENMSDKKI